MPCVQMAAQKNKQKHASKMKIWLLEIKPLYVPSLHSCLYQVRAVCTHLVVDTLLLPLADL